MFENALPLAVLAIIAWLLARVFYGYSDVVRRVNGGRPFSVLHLREAALVDAVGEAMFPAGGAVPYSSREAGVCDHTDRYLRALDPAKRLQIRLLFALVEHATLFFPGPGIGGLRRFSSQGREAREAILRSWSSSGLALRRLLFQALRAVMTMAYLGTPGVLRSLQLAPLAFESPVTEADCLYPPIGEGPEAITHGAEDLTPPSRGVPLEIGGEVHPDYAAPADEGATG